MVRLYNTLHVKTFKFNFGHCPKLKTQPLQPWAPSTNPSDSYIHLNKQANHSLMTECKVKLVWWVNFLHG